MNTARQQLRKELHQAGAKAPEIDRLVSVAGSLSLLRVRSGRQSWKILKPALLVSSSLALGAIIVILAQSVTPTSWLYTVQKVSDAVAVKAHPEYRATIMMRRAQQVNELVASHASSQVILSTLASYETESSDYKVMPHASYAAFDYCKTNLEQAADAAPAGVRQAIINSVESLDTT